MGRIASLAVTLIVLAAPFHAAAVDRVILGKLLKIDDPSTATKRRVRGIGRETSTDVPSLSDPRVAGATLTVIANGGTDSTQSYALDAAGWKAAGSGYRYKGPTGADGDPVRKVLLTRTANGRASITILATGNLGTQGILVTPQNPGASGGFVLDVAAGDRYCVRLGGLAGGTTRRDDARRWDIRNATAEAGCPAPDTTTTTSTTTTTLAAVCGNGVREGTEQCDGTDLPFECGPSTSGASECMPAGGADECRCCAPPTGLIHHEGSSEFVLCCDGQPCQPTGPGFCQCPGTCGGSPFPTCGGSCTGDNLVCSALTNGAGTDFCGCVFPGPCDAACSGASCPAGQACNYVTCGCVTP
jgi:hypothetical protein